MSSVTMVNNYYYHVTTEDKVESILQNGLQPQKGNNSEKVEEESLVFLSEWDSVRYWAAILGRKVMLRVPKDKVNSPERYNRGLYDEVLTESPVYGMELCDFYAPELSDIEMRKLICNYTGMLNMFCTNLANLYTRYPDSDVDTRTYLGNSISATLTVMKRLNWSVVTPSDLAKYLEEEGDDGEFTICDYYLNTGRKLYEQLVFYPVDALTPIRKRLHDFIVDKYNVALYVQTGGYTG